MEAWCRSPGKRAPARWSPFSAAVHRHPRELGKAATRLCRDVVRRPPGWCYALCTPLFLAGRLPLQRGDATMEKLTLTLHKTKDTKNKVV